MKKAAVIMLAVVFALSALTGCGNTDAAQDTQEGSTAAAENRIEDNSDDIQTEEENGSVENTENGQDDSSAGLSSSQQELVEKVFGQLENKEYDALFADMIYPGNSVVKVDDLKNFFVLSLTMDEVENGTQKEKINERFEDGFIKFDYGLEAGGYTTVYILENADTPDGYEVRLAGFSGDLYSGEQSNSTQETILILPSGLTNVVVDGVKLDDYVDDTYYEGFDEDALGFDPADYTTYRVVFPCLDYAEIMTDEMAEMMEDDYGFELGRYKFEITADSLYGTLEGELEKDGSHFTDWGLGDHEGELFQPLDSTAANDMLLELLQNIFDKANEGYFDIDSYREFFVDGADDAVIQELTDALDEHFNDNVGTISNLKAEEVHTYTEEIYYDVPMVEYIGSDKMDMDIGVHSSYDQNMTYSESHKDAYQQLHLTVQTDGDTVKIVEFAENSHLGNLFNYLSSGFDN